MLGFSLVYREDRIVHFSHLKHAILELVELLLVFYVEPYS